MALAAPVAVVAAVAHSYRDSAGMAMSDKTVVTAAWEEKAPEVGAATYPRTAPCRTWLGPHTDHPLV